MSSDSLARALIFVADEPLAAAEYGVNRHVVSRARLLRRGIRLEYATLDQPGTALQHNVLALISARWRL